MESRLEDEHVAATSGAGFGQGCGEPCQHKRTGLGKYLVGISEICIVAGKGKGASGCRYRSSSFKGCLIACEGEGASPGGE